MKSKYFKALKTGGLVAALFMSAAVKAQCPAPTSASVTPTNITCAGSGAITVNSVNNGGINLSDCRYTLYNAENTTIVIPEQSGTTIGGLDSGTYTLHIHQVCQPSGVSADYTQTVQLTGYYEMPVLGMPVTTDATCNDGSISIIATKGYGAYSYCLVNALNDPAIPSGYVRAPQATGNFTGLAGGTYYVRVYDQCNGFVTMPVVVAAVPATTPFGPYNMDLNGCANYIIGQSLNWYVPRDANNKMWVNYPDGTIDTLPDYYTTNNVGVDVPFSKLTAYPATVTLSYKNACGNIFSNSYTFNQPGYYMNDQTAVNYTCGMGTYNINTPYLHDSFNNLNSPYNIWDAYSLDGGATWISYTIPMTDTILVPVGGSRQVIYRRCGQQYPVTVNGPDVQTLNMRMFQDGDLNCANNASIRIDASGYNGNINKIWVQVTSVPAGQAPIPSFFFAAEYSTNFMRPSQLMNLVPGTYTFLFTDECGDTQIQSITLTPSHKTVTVTPQYTCGVNTVGLNIHYTSDQGAGGYLACEVKDQNGNVVASPAVYGGTDIMVSNLVPGIFTVKVWRYRDTINTLACPYTFTVDAHLPGALSLNKSIFALCTNDLATGSVIALPADGLPPYTYTLYKGSISTTNQVGVPQSSNIFSGLDANASYIITATDQCGAGASFTNVFGNVQPMIYTSIPTVPCIGDSITLSVSKNEGLSYQWTKNGTNIANATDTFYKIKPMTMADSGIYVVNISANSCLLLSTAANLNPKNCGVPIPLAIDMVSFSGKLNTTNNAVLHWTIAQPERGAKYEVLYSTDGNKFNIAGTVYEDGTATSFSFTHHNYTITQKTFYKLLMTETDGKQKYSTTLALQPDKNAVINTTLAAAPIPFSSSINVSYTSATAMEATLCSWRHKQLFNDGS